MCSVLGAQSSNCLKHFRSHYAYVLVAQTEFLPSCHGRKTSKGLFYGNTAVLLSAHEDFENTRFNLNMKLQSDSNLLQHMSSLHFLNIDYNHFYVNFKI